MARVYEGLNVDSDLGGLFPWKSKKLLADGKNKMAFVDEGPKDATLTFLCIHGNPTWGVLYREFIRRLSPTYRIVVPDHIGFGRSDKPREPGYYTLERHIDNLNALVEKLGLTNVVPVIQDWGGPIGLGYATQHTKDIKGIVVLNTWSFVSEHGGVRLPWFFKLLLLGRGGWRRATKKNMFVELMLVKGQKLGVAEADAYRAPHPTPDDRIGIARFPQLIPEIGRPEHEAHGTMKRIEDQLGLLALKPALILWPMKDVAFRKAQLLRWQEVFPRHVVHRLEGAKHYAQESHSTQMLDEILKWAKTLGKQDAALRGATKKTGKS